MASSTIKKDGIIRRQADYVVGDYGAITVTKQSTEALISVQVLNYYVHAYRLNGVAGGISVLLTDYLGNAIAKGTQVTAITYSYIE